MYAGLDWRLRVLELTQRLDRTKDERSGIISFG